MAVTKQLRRAQWKEYFDNFTKAFLKDLNPEDAVVEIVDPKLGDQFESDYARVIGITYDPKDNVFEVALEGVDHLVEGDHPAAECGVAASVAVMKQQKACVW